MTVRSLTLKKSALAATAAAGLVAGLVGTGLGVSSAQAAPASPPMTQNSLLRFDDLNRAGIAADGATLGSRGDQLLGDAGRFDEGCLGEKTMRNITGAKAYPAPGTAKSYLDGAWTNTQDKDVWVNESIADGRDATSSNRYVKSLLAEIRNVTSCEEDPAQGHHYGPARTATAGTATASYFLDHTADGATTGGGVAVIRDGNRVGFVSLMSAPGRPGVVLKSLAVAAAGNLR